MSILNFKILTLFYFQRSHTAKFQICISYFMRIESSVVLTSKFGIFYEKFSTTRDRPTDNFQIQPFFFI